MTPTPNLASQGLRTPRAAAIAGVIFSVLMVSAWGIIYFAASTNRATPRICLSDTLWRNAIRLALDLVPLAGVAFLWFLGVLRNHLGQREDQFFATVFLGSGLLFVACLFVAAAVLGTVLETVPLGKGFALNTETSGFGLQLSRTLMNVFAIKMAAVFMFSTSTVALRTTFLPRWVAIFGYAFAIALLLIITDWIWIEMVFPLWILLVSLRILSANFAREKNRSPLAPAHP